MRVLVLSAVWLSVFYGSCELMAGAGILFSNDMRNFVFAFLCVAGVLRAQDYSLGPDSQPQAGVPKGVVTRYKLSPGKYYPGSPHNYQVYVPAQYDAAKPTAFMIYMDGGGAAGNSQRVPVVFDNLIAKHELPVMIGIFVDPGVLPALSPEAQSRFERVFEYDSMSDRFANFLIDELIPEVGKKYNLSKDPNDRGLAGVSTGAVGAFMAAWNRPDQFRRVITFIGTFVAMKGAEAMPTLIRKTEPKPLRIFLQDGKNDHIVPGQPYGTFYGGSWPINNQVMLEALEFAGYDAKLVIGEGGHDMKQGAAIMPDALRWIWRDYPKPIPQGVPAEMGKPGWDTRGKVYSVVSADKPWVQVGAGYKAINGVAAEKNGGVVFSADRIYRADANGKVTALGGETAGASALRVGADGRIYAAQLTPKRIVSYAAGGGDEKVAASNVEAADLAINKAGAIYFTDSGRGTVNLVDVNGKSRVVLKSGEMEKPYGLTLSPDQAMLVVTDAISRYSWSYQIAPDGSLINGEPFFRLELPETGPGSGVHGVAEDSIGQVYFATPLGIQVTEANGRVAMILNAPEHGRISAFALAGNSIFAEENGKLFRRPVKVEGAGAWTIMKLPKPPL